jgi:amidophosphoribosyltransferase
MATLQELVAFEAAVEIARRQGPANHLKTCYARAKAQLADPGSGEANWLKAFYDAIPQDALAPMIASLLKPADMKAELEVVFQTPADLRRCCPEHTGDWYFTGDYPTPGGHRVANQALVNYMENHNERAY